MIKSESSQYQEQDYMFKLVLIGDTSVGKTNLLLRYTKDEFSHSQQATVGAEISSKRLVLKSQGGQDKVIKTHFWDTAGQEQFKSISSQFYKAASGVVFIYDITRKDTFHNVNHWLQEVKDYADANIIRLLIGNKKDLQQNKEVTTDEALQFAQKNNMAFFEASALDGTNVEKAFGFIINEVFKMSQEQGDKHKSTSTKIRLPPKKKDNNCC